MSSITLLLSMPGGSEWILIILAVLILFGGRKIPEFMRGLGRWYSKNLMMPKTAPNVSCMKA